MAFSLMQSISFIYVLAIFTCTTSSLLSHEEECLALFQFKQSIFHQDYASFDDSGGFQKFKSWRKITSNTSDDNGSDCCLWDGVDCSKDNHVIGLDLSQRSLHGRITSNSTIFDLVNLQVLNLSTNNFVESRIPSEIARLKQLRSLDLSNSSFSGEIPKEISHLMQLTSLDLSWNPLKLQSPSLEYLLQNFTGHVPHSLSNMTQLSYLSLGGNELIGIVPSLASLSNLIVLELSYNSFDKGSLPYWLSKLTNLNELYLNGMNIVHEIPPFLANLTKLSFVHIGENYITGQIPSSFMNLTQLVSLNLERNQLQGPISSTFSKFKGLEHLTLEANSFSGKLDLDTFIGLDKLKELELNSNRITLIDTKNYTGDTLSKLEYLGLATCNMTEFPAFLRFQNKLIALFLDENKIGGLVPVWIWNNSKTTMRVIDLSHNFITGFAQQPHFLPWFFLEAFVISYNQLGGQMPIPPLTTELYDVSNNFLTGQIPPLICEAKFLQYLDLSSNNITGTLPPCLGILTNSLLVLNLNRNHLHGTMMNTFTNGSRLKRIDLSENRFIGQVPKSLTNCTNLEVISLGDNSFNGAFPFWLGTLEELQVLILRSNKFHGALQPPTIGSSQFSQLRIIDLSNNGFSGRLTELYFHSWKVMKSDFGGKPFAMNSDMHIDSFMKLNPYSMTLTNKGVKREYEKILSIFTAIDLSCNNFEGNIPQSIQDLHGLESLNLSNNHLTGPIPSFGNLRNIESLDLSHNELSGEIPQQLLQLGFLAVLNVSFNYLDGPIPQGKQFNTFQNNSYIGNVGLCGEPLSKECRNSNLSNLPPIGNESDSLLPGERIDWIIIFSGVGSGLVIGIVIGNFWYGKYSDWLLERLGMKKERWVRPLRNTSRN